MGIDRSHMVAMYGKLLDLMITANDTRAKVIVDGAQKTFYIPQVAIKHDSLYKVIDRLANYGDGVTIKIVPLSDSPFKDFVVPGVRVNRSISVKASLDSIEAMAKIIAPDNTEISDAIRIHELRETHAKELRDVKKMIDSAIINARAGGYVDYTDIRGRLLGMEIKWHASSVAELNRTMGKRRVDSE